MPRGVPECSVHRVFASSKNPCGLVHTRFCTTFANYATEEAAFDHFYHFHSRNGRARSTSASLRTALHCQRCTVRNIVHPAPPPSQEEAERSGSSQEKPSAAASGGTAQRSTKALPVQQRLEALHKVYALAFAFSAAHIQRAPLHSAQSYTVRSATQCAAMHSAQHCIARTIAQRPALHCAQRFIASVVQCATLYPRLPRGGE